MDKKKSKEKAKKKKPDKKSAVKQTAPAKKTTKPKPATAPKAKPSSVGKAVSMPEAKKKPKLKPKAAAVAAAPSEKPAPIPKVLPEKKEVAQPQIPPVKKEAARPVVAKPVAEKPKKKPAVTKTAVEPVAPPPVAKEIPKEIPVVEEKVKEIPVAPPPVVEKKPEEAPKPVSRGTLAVNDCTTIKEVASMLGVSINEVIKTAIGFGQYVTANQKLDKALAEMIGSKFNYEIKFETLLPRIPDEEITGNVTRAPIVTVMGHVDHGKTTLLDTIRKSNVVAAEHGGITQHIGAYKVKTPKGEITFLDTPGHEAFTAMRARGSKVTDIVVLVVSAADGVMPQTVEAINHARAAKVPIIVAINKIDLPTANPERVKNELNQHNLTAEEWGGDTLMVEISARNNINMDKLMDAILLQAELMELKCNPDVPAVGSVIESKLDAKRGHYVTVVVRNGTLKTGDVFVAGDAHGKVRAMFDEFGNRLDVAAPSTPVAIIGAASLPSPGDRFYVVKTEREAREIIEKRKERLKEVLMKPAKVFGLSDFTKKEEKVLKIILKADVAGSLEAINEYIERIEHPEFKVQIIHAGVGTITESDVNLARTTESVIIGFNVKAETSAQSLAERYGIEIRTYRVIYELFDDVKKALEGLLAPKIQEVVTGKAEVRKVMKITKAGIVAGSYVSEGKVTRHSKCRLIRDGAIVYDGRIASLRRFKEDVAGVDKGFECGITLENFQDIKENDIIEVYSIEKVKRFL